jgi:hypothetical protein
MKDFKLNGRKVVDVEVALGSTKDIVDAYIDSATYENTGEPLSDAELDRLQELYPERVEYLAYELGAYN